ncbi:putative virion structural protein [Vibrio phage pVa-21]|nr:putative virion structural protein [Vibrio phage pVa-21]
MYNLKGFIEITAFANNIPKNISPLGELSNMSLSYATEKGYYSKADAPNVELVTFTSKKDEEKIETPAKYHAHVLEIAQWVFNKSVAGSLNDDPEHFRTLFLAEFQDRIGDAEIGLMETAKNNWMPTYIKWNLDDGGEENELRVWFADEAFKAQYDEFEIVVIPPIEPVDTFMKTVEYVKPALDQFNLPDHDVKVAQLAEENPYSNRVTREYPWYDREDPDTSLMTNWTVIIYGIAGNNPLVIKEAIAEYILANSVYGREDWVPVFPDIFTSTEFVIVPMWHNRSVPDETVRGQLYSPIVPYDEAGVLAEKYIKYPKAGHVLKYLDISTVHYKSLAFVCSGGIENRDNKYKLKDYFPDYALIASRSADFNRLNKYTTDWIFMLQNAVIAAEEMDEYSYLDVEYARVERDGLFYVGFSYDNVLYMVLSRLSMEEAVAQEQAA